MCNTLFASTAKLCCVQRGLWPASGRECKDRHRAEVLKLSPSLHCLLLADIPHLQALQYITHALLRESMIEVKASHTRYRAMGPELIPVYRQVTVSHPPGGRLPLLSARPAVTSPASGHHHPLASTK